jgi:hypothetical protein
MHKIVQLVCGLMMMLFVSQCYAITVRVSSPSQGLTGIGFKVNGSKHGGIGNSYKTSKMPAGNYSFGMRKNGKDIHCGKMKLQKSSRVVLTMKAGKCSAKIK